MINGYARKATIDNSEKDTNAPTNDDGQFPNSSRNIGRSDNFWREGFGRFTKVGGTRVNENEGGGKDTFFSLGGIQGGRGRLLWWGYSAGSWEDHIVESFSGLHDLLKSPVGYNGYGNNVSKSGLGAVAFGPYNAVNVLLTAPFAIASLRSAFDPASYSQPAVRNQFWQRAD